MAVDRPILGADFPLRAHRLPQPIPAANPNPQASNLFTALLSTPGPYRELLNDFPELLGSSFSDLDPKHGVEHHIQTTGPPVFSKAGRLNPTKLAIAKVEFESMEAAGICRRSNSSWAFPSPHW